MRRRLVGAVLLDLAVSPLFVWDVLSAPLAGEVGRPVAALSVVYAVGLAVFTAGVLLGGRWSDRVAPRALAWLTAVGVAGGLLVAALAVAAGSLALLLTGFGVLLGFATGAGYATAIRVASAAASRRGTAVALVASAYAAGAMVLAPVADLLLAEVGPAATLTLLAVALAVLLVAAGLLLDDRPPSPAPTTTSRARVPPTPYRTSVVTLWAVFLLGCGPGLVAFGHAGRLAGDVDLAATAVLLLNAGNLLGRLLAGPLADRLGTGRSLHLAAATLTGATLALAASGSAAVALAALLLVGTEYGAVSVLVPLAVGGAVPGERFGAAYGVVFTGWGAAGLVGPVAAAVLADATSYPTVAWALLGAAVLFWAAAVPAARRADAAA